MTISIDDLVNSHKLASPAQPRFGTHINDQAVIRLPTYDAVAAFLAANPAVGEDDFDDYVDEYYPWLWIYAGVGNNDAGNFRLKFRNMTGSILSKTTGLWTNFTTTQMPSNQQWDGNTQGAFGSSYVRQEADGAYSVQLTGTIGVECWVPPEHMLSRSQIVDAKAFAAHCEIQIIDSAGNPYNGSDAVACVSLGSDLYGDRSRGGASTYSNGYPRIRADGFNRYWRNYTGSAWQSVGVITMESYKQDENPYNGYSTSPPWGYDKTPYTLTEAEVRANPPSWVTATSTPAPAPAPAPAPVTGELLTTGALKVGLIGFGTDYAGASEYLRSQMNGGKVQVFDGGIKVAEGAASVTVSADLRVNVAKTNLTATADIFTADTDLTAALTNVAQTGSIVGRIDGDTFTLSGDVADTETVEAGPFSLPFIEDEEVIVVTPGTPTNPIDDSLVYTPPTDVLNGTAAIPAGFPANTEVVLAYNASIVIPARYGRIHTDHAADGKVPTYGVGGYRTHDSAVRAVYDLKMNMEWWWTGNGSYNTSDLDYYFGAVDQPVVVGLFGCADFNNANPTRPSRYGSNDRLAGLAEPPIDASLYADVCGFLRNRYPDQIAGFESGNEAKFGYNGNADPAVDTWLTNGYSAGFWHGTANQLADIYRYMKQGAGSVPIIGPGWEGGAYATQAEEDSGNLTADSAIAISSKWNSTVLFHGYATSGGQSVNNYIDANASHVYYYAPNNSVSSMRSVVHEARRYTKYYNSVTPGKRRHCTEAGFEDPPGGLGASIISATDRGNVIKKITMLYALLGYSSIYWYKHSDAKTLGNPHDNATVAAALQWVKDLDNLAIKDGAFLSDGRIWYRTTAGVEGYLA